MDQSIWKITKRRPREAPDHQEASKRRKKPPQKHPKSFQNLPNSTTNQFKRPLGSHVGPMLLKSWISNTRKNDQEAPKRGPRPPRGAQESPQSVPNPFQMEPKTLPNQIFEQFWRLFFSGRKFASFFCSFVAEFVCFCKSRPLKFMRPRSVSLTSTRFGMFRKKYQKSSKNLLKTCPKSRKNQRKIDKNENKSMEKAKMSEENQKMRYKYEKMRK